MKNSLLSKVFLKLLVWEECGLKVVTSIDYIVGIGFPDFLNSSAAGVIVGVFLCVLDMMVSTKAEYLS